MPYDKPKQSSKGWILPKKSGGLHKSKSGKVIHFKSRISAQKAANAIMAKEHGWNPKKRR